MKRQMLTAMLALGVAYFGASSDAVAQQAAVAGTKSQPDAKYKVVFQVSDNDPAKWNLALNNAKNVQKDLGSENVEIEIVAYGPGLNMLKLESPVAGRLNSALNDKVSIVACDNTMHSMKLTDADLVGGAKHVKAGVVQLMERQRQGWSYIRP